MKGRGVIVLLVKDIFMMFVVQMKRNNKPCACWLLKMFYFSFLKKKPDKLFFKKRTRSNVFLIILGICLRIRTTYQIAGKYNKTPFKSSKKYSLRIMILLKWVEKKL